MRPFLALVRRLIAESRWTLGISCGAMFLFGWLTTYVMAREIGRFKKALESGEGRFRMLREMAGQDVQITVANLEMQFWMHPFLWLPIVAWAIGRGSLAVGGELERGSMDLVLSRPVSRFSYLASHVAVNLIGLVALAALLVAGNRIATRFNALEDPPTTALLFWPALNLTALGLSIFGLTLAVSAFDRVRWRATLVGSAITVSGLAALIVAGLPAMADSPLKPWLNRIALFRFYNPIDAVGEATQLAGNLAALGGIGLAGIVLAFAVFLFRDLPASA